MLGLSLFLPLWAQNFHVIEFIGIERLVFLKVVEIEETKVNVQKSSQITSPSMENESREMEI